MHFVREIWLRHVKCDTAREGIYFISYCDEGAIFHNFHKEIISHSTDTEYFTKAPITFTICKPFKATIVFASHSSMSLRMKSLFLLTILRFYGKIKIRIIGNFFAGGI